MYQYLIIVTDLLTLYAEAYPVPDKSSETVAKGLTERLIPTPSCPKQSYLTIEQRMKIKL